LYFSLLSSHSVADSGCLFDNFLVADPDPGKSEGGDAREVRRVGGGGGWAEDMEGRSVLSVTLVYIIILDCSRQPAVLSVTLVYIIILDCSRQPASGSQPASRTEATAATGAIFSLSEKKELGKGGVVESSGDQVFFYFFSGSRTFFGYNKPIPDPGSRGQKGTLSRIRIRIKSIRIRIRREGGGVLRLKG
jgi:hypothetical protein